MWQPTHVKVTVRQAKGLLCKGKNGTNDAFVVIGMGKEKFQTSVKPKAPSTVQWREECELAIPSQGNKATLQLTVYHHNSLGIDEFLGQTSLSLTDFDVYEKPKYKSYKLQGKADKSKKKAEKDRGEIEVLVNFTVKSGSFLDISKKEKNKSTTSLKHLGGSLLSFGGGKDKHGLKDFARSVSSKMDKLSISKKKKRKDSNTLPNELMESKQHFGDADPGVISDDDDEFRFDDDIKVYTQSSSPQSTLSRDSSSIQEPPYGDGTFNQGDHHFSQGPDIIDAPTPLTETDKADNETTSVIVSPPSPIEPEDQFPSVVELPTHEYLESSDDTMTQFKRKLSSPKSRAKIFAPVFMEEEEEMCSDNEEIVEKDSFVKNEPINPFMEENIRDIPENVLGNKSKVESGSINSYEEEFVLESHPEQIDGIQTEIPHTDGNDLSIAHKNEDDYSNEFEVLSSEKMKTSKVPSTYFGTDINASKVPDNEKSLVKQARKSISFPFKDHLDNSVSRTSSLKEENRKYNRHSITGSNGNISLNDSQTSLNFSRASSSYDVRKEDFRQPEIKALTLERRHEDNDTGEGRKRKKITVLKNKLFHKENRDRIHDEDSRIVEGGNDRVPSPPTRTTKLPQEIHDKFAGKSREDLLEMILNLQGTLNKQVQHSSDLENYIDNLLLRVMEATPQLLHASNGQRIKHFGSF